MKNRFLPFACLASLLLPVATFGNVGNHSLFIKTDGSLWGMGLNSSGQLGNGTNSAVTTPQKMVDANSTNPIVEVSTGATHTLFIRKDGSLWGMGGNNRGQLGDGNLTDRNTPVRIVSSGVASCSSGYYHSLFIKADGSLWGMGDNFCGQLGIDVAGGSSGGFDEGIDKKTPVQILSSGVNQASAGKNFSVFVKSDGSLWGMGESHLGRLGRDWDGGANDTFNAAYDHKVPVRIMESEVIEVEAGAQFTLVRKTDGSAWSFGDNWKGQLADGNRPVNNKDPYRFLDANVTQISASWSFGAALLENGSLLTFGGNNVGQLGDGTNVDRNQSVEVFSSGINQVATGIGHTMILKTDGSLWTVGTNRFGQLGTGQSGGGNNSFDEGIDEKTPVQVVASGVHRLINVQANAAPNFHPNHPILEVAENRPVGTIVGEFNATDTDANATLTYSLVDGNGSTHNNLFTLDANGTLKTNATFDYETKASAHSIRVQVKDEHNFTKEKVFTVNITDTNEAPNLGAGAGSFALSIPESSNPVSIPATWDRTFGGTGVDKLAVTIKTSDGGYLLTGTSDSNASAEKSENSRGGKDYWLVKVDPSGNKVWDRTFGGSEEDLCYGATEVSGGGYLVYGTSLSPADGDRSAQNKGNQDFWIVRIDANGNKLWDKAYGGNGHDNCYDVIQTDDGGYLLGGRSNSSAGGDVGEAGRGEVDYWIVKIDANGNKLWDKRYGGGGWDGFWRILSIPGGGYLLGGSSTSNASGEKSENKQGRSDYWVVRIDANGSKLWDKTYGGTGDDWISGMTLTNDDGFLLTAYSDSNASGDKSEGSENTLNYWMVRIDANGSKLWDKTLISQSGSHSKDLIATDDGNYIVLGLAWASGEGGDRSHPTYGKADFWAVKIDDEGNKLWDKNFGGSGGDFGQSVIPTDDEGYLFTGHAWTGISFDKSEACRGNYDYWVVKTDADGNRNHFATDPDGDTLAWSISGGTDASKFTINAATGELTLNSSDYENPTDADGNNTYEVELTVTDPDNLTASKQVTINVTDVNDAPEIAQGAGPITFTIPEDAGVVSWSPWDKTFGGSFGDACNDVIATVDGGYLLVGDSNSTNDGDRSEGSRGGRDFWAVKIDASGAKVWDKRYGGSGNDLCRDVIATSDGGYLLAGWSDSPANGDKSEASRGHGDYWIVKIDENGTKLWDKRYGGTGWDYCCSVTATTDGDYLLAGYSMSNANGDKSESVRGGYDYWAVKIDENGSKVWDKTFGGSGVEFLADSVASSDGGYLLAGYSESNATGDKSEASRGDWDYWAVKIDTNGNKLWDKRFGGSNGDLCTSVLATGDGGYLLTGGSHSGADGDKSQTSRGGNDFWAVKVDSNGAKVWDKRFGGSAGDRCFSVTATADGNYVLAGESWSWASGDHSEGRRGELDFWAVKIDVLGNKVWDKRFGGNGYELCKSIVSTPDGGYLLAGRSDSNATGDKSEASRGTFDYWAVKVDADGSRPLYATDPDGDALTWTLQTPPTNGGAVVSGTGLAPSTFSYAPDANFNGSDSLVVTVSDGNGSSASITVNLSITPVNDIPESINLKGTVTKENQPVGTVIGEFNATDPDANATLNYSLVEGNGSTHNHLFSIHADGKLKTKAVLDFEANATLSIRVKGTDEQNASVEKAFAINIINTDAPIVRTLDATSLADGGFRFAGKVLADGGSEVTSVGIRLSEDLEFSNPSNLPGTLASGASEFTVTKTGLKPGKRYYYQAYATNAEGTSYGSPKHLTTPKAEQPWWSDANQSASGWRTSAWFGSFLPYDNGWIHHEGLGWAYASPDGSGGLWLWLDSHGWLWTKEGVWPYLYGHDESGWLYFLGKKNGKPVFYDWGAGPVTLRIDPTCIRRIRGISELRRETYFGLCDKGSGFDRRSKTTERYRYLVQELGITPGRRLGVVHQFQRYDKAVREDPNHPGYADLEFIKQVFEDKVLEEPGEEFRSDMNGRLEIAAHGYHNAFPEFMGKLSTAYSINDGNRYYPENIDAAAELSAQALKWKFSDFDRPAFYEPVNEPHWSFWRENSFHQWHTKTMQAVKSLNLDVKVGGPCLSVGYYYKNKYKAFDGLKSFIDGTGCNLDFYSFHAYDFLREKDGDFAGRITSGMPLESVLDLVSNYTMNEYGKEVDVVLSEHGAYGDLDLVEKLAEKHFPGEGFEWEMKKRSIVDFNMVNGVIANTMVFMDHPHVVKKAVPFILLESMDWNASYYATLYVPHGFEDKTNWVETKQILFYKLMRDIRGNRVDAASPDPDLQLQAFVDGRTVFVIVNNLSATTHKFSLEMPAPESMTVRRVGRNPDFTPYYREKSVTAQGLAEIAPREAMVMVLRYKELSPGKTVDEIPFYGNRVRTSVVGTTDFTVNVPDAEDAVYAELRVGISRPSSAGRAVAISLNGQELNVSEEDAAERIDNGKDYATCKIIRIPSGLIKTANTVAVTFPDGGEGAVGAVVIRAAFEK